MDKSEDLISSKTGKSEDLKVDRFYYLAALIIIVYMIFGFLLEHSVFFSYDMPRVGLIVQDFLNRGSYMTSQYFYSESTWQNVAWGPALVFFYSLFLKLSSDPLIVSRFLVLLNGFSIFAIMILCRKVFSSRVGLVAGALLAFNPYWFVYTRIIYQPSPLTFLLPVAMLLHFGFIKSNKYSTILLPIVWLAMFQIYIPSLAFILTSAIFSIFYINKVNYKFLFLGIIFASLLFIPSLKFYKENPQYLSKFFSAPKLFTPNERTYSERIKNVTNSFVNIPLGGMYTWQTGSSYDDFFENNKMLSPDYSNFLSIFFIIGLIISTYISIKNRDMNRAVIVAWSLSSLWYLILLWTSNLPPRYFLISFPPIMILLSLTIEDILIAFSKYKMLKNIGLIAPVLIIGYWLVFDIKYNKFIKDYDFPHGWFNDVSESPYVYIKGSLDWIIDDSINNNCNAIISNDVNNPNFGLWMEFEYPWRYIYKKSMIFSGGTNNCQYFILKTDNNSISLKHKNFGPFVVFKMF